MPRRPDKPIIESLLDIDFYKFTMGQLVFHRHPNVPVEYALVNRTTGVKLSREIDEGELREQLDHAMSLRFNRSEIHYLRGTNEYQDRMFQEDYLDFLLTLSLPPYEIDWPRGTLKFYGPWSHTIYWETIALSIVNELFHRRGIPQGWARRATIDQDIARGRLKLGEKIEAIRRLSYLDVRFSDFGTRRRFSRDWQDYVVSIMAEELPTQFLGTSNTHLAMKYGLLPMGTSAHEMFMAYSGICHESDDTILESHNRVLQDWWSEYGWGLSIALTDTYGTDFFFRDMTDEQAKEWKGLRQDSGDPIEFGRKAIDFYESRGIDPKTKLVVFSDGLDLNRIMELAREFQSKINVSFGWGTNLTNDLGHKTLSLVVKLVRANGHGTVKLSDNIAKAIGKPEDIERFKSIFGYASTLNEACRY
ncbi:MAG: nicotinate phosphoribosyltransferase [Parcubacteria group bacterium Gr01-1014_20]|nr:MAG: nicotinate phosphoribosyltransferase [Parcubacteria group bacterium Gr01-1014_20]